MKAKSALTVGANVFVVQKTKKTPGVVEKINQTRAIVNMKGRSYNVPFSMLENLNDYQSKKVDHLLPL